LEFFEGYGRLDRSVRGLDGAAEWPVLRTMLPDLAGKRVLDLGCGFGWFSRWARQNGAADVHAFDLSERMIARASAETNDERIVYTIADLEDLALPAGAFDFAFSSLAFHYLADFGSMARRVHRALTAGSSFVFTIEHPIYMAPAKPGWVADAKGNRSWALNAYALEGPRETDWLAKDVVKYHRTLATTLNALIDSGFALRKIHEWSPSAEALKANPALRDEVDRPMFLLIGAQRE
jgi:SAM-dependent methyltransferase